MSNIHLICPTSVDWGSGKKMSPQYIAQAFQYVERARNQANEKEKAKTVPVNMSLPFGYIRFLEEATGYWRVFVVKSGAPVFSNEGPLVSDLFSGLMDCNLLIDTSVLDRIKRALAAADHMIVEHFVGPLKLDGRA